MKTLLNVNNVFYFNGDKITKNDYVELLNTTFAANVLFNFNDEENNLVIKVKL